MIFTPSPERWSNSFDYLSFVYTLMSIEKLYLEVARFVFSRGDGWYLAAGAATPVAPAAVGRWFTTSRGRIWIEEMVCAE